jgi:glutamate-1-semialdehyde aminotransferase
MSQHGHNAPAAWDHDLDELLHLHLFNRGIVMMPFHTVALMSPATTEADVDRHTAVFREAVADLAG